MKDGGPAFPESVRTTDLAGNPLAIIKNGMSLRDYFAAAALTGMCARGEHHGSLHKYAYEIADAMLAERDK